MLALLSIICIYGALASLVNSIFSQTLLPLGPPLIKVTNKNISIVWIPSIHQILIGMIFWGGFGETDHFYFLSQAKVKEESDLVLQCPTFKSRFTSSLLKIGHLLEEGGVCGIPTDTVYALAASCKNPEAIEKIYNIKVSLRKQVRR